MRILQLGPYPPPHGGVQTNLVAIREYLLARNIPCAVINLTRHRRPDAGHVFYPKSPFELARLLLRLKYDIAHLHLGGDLTPRLLGLSLLCCSIPGKKTVLTFHSGGYPSSPAGRSTHRRTARAFVMRRFDRLIGVNPEIAAFFQKCGVPESRIRLIYPHAPVVQAAGTTLTPELRAFFDTHHPVLLSVGLLEPEYDLSQQIKLVGLVLKNRPNAGLVIIGSGSLEPSLRTEIETMPYSRNILLCGDVTHALTLRAIGDASALLRTTLYDGDSVAVREALSLGTPVIATDNGMRPPGVILIPPASLAELHRATEECLTNGKRPAAPQNVSDENISQVLQLYRELLGTAPPPSPDLPSPDR